MVRKPSKKKLAKKAAFFTAMALLASLKILTMFCSLPEDRSGSEKPLSLSNGHLSNFTGFHARDSEKITYSDQGCSTLLRLRSEGVKIINCASCIEQGGNIKARNVSCFLSKECRDNEIVDGVLWGGGSIDHFPEARRDAASKHQIWIVRAIETHALPYVNRSIGDAAWMSPMNYARHFGTNTDFPGYGIPQRRSWPKLEQPLLDKKTVGILYMTSNCEVQSERDDFARRASYFMDISSVGSCFHNTDVPLRIKHLEEDADGKNLRQRWGDYGPAAHEIVSMYRFRLVIISSFCVDYYAEKIEQTLNAGAIPIYLGMPNSHDWDPGIAAGVHPAMIHVQDFNSLSELADFVNELGADTESARARRLRYFEYRGKEPFMFPRHWKKMLSLTGGEGWLEFVCRRTHDGDPGRRAGEQAPCSGPWWKYFEMIGKNLTLWGCSGISPCSSA
jgi:hypothetical protein